MSSEIATYLPNSLSDATEIALPAPISVFTISSKDEIAAEITAIGSSLEELSDEYLMSQVVVGNRDALSILFRRHARSVFSVSNRILRDSSEAEDLLQDLFLFIFQKAHLFDASKSLATSWIIQMTYHRAIDRRKYLSVRHHYDVREVNEERQQASQGQISIDEIAGRALLNELRAELSSEQQQVLELHLFEGYTFHEIADKTGQAFGNIRNHYYRSLEKLRSLVFTGKTRQK